MFQEQCYLVQYSSSVVTFFPETFLKSCVLLRQSLFIALLFIFFDSQLLLAHYCMFVCDKLLTTTMKRSYSCVNRRVNLKNALAPHSERVKVALFCSTLQHVGRNS